MNEAVDRDRETGKNDKDKRKSETQILRNIFSQSFFHIVYFSFFFAHFFHILRKEFLTLLLFHLRYSIVFELLLFKFNKKEGTDEPNLPHHQTSYFSIIKIVIVTVFEIFKKNIQTTSHRSWFLSSTSYVCKPMDFPLKEQTEHNRTVKIT